MGKSEGSRAPVIRVVAPSASAWKALRVEGTASIAQLRVDPSATRSREAGAMSWGTATEVGSSPSEVQPASTGIVSTPVARSATERRFRAVPRGTPTWDMADTSGAGPAHPVPEGTG